MNVNMILAGVGGQGILTIATILDLAASQQQLHIKQSEVHGMSQRGGAVVSHVRISDNPIYSDVIPKGKADIIISLEPLESLRYLPFLKKDGWIITNSEPFLNINDYPKMDDLINEIKKIKNHLIINSDEISKKCGTSKASNIVMLGAASNQLPISENTLLKTINKLFKAKGERIIKLNLEAFNAGKQAVTKINY